LDLDLRCSGVVDHVAELCSVPVDGCRGNESGPRNVESKAGSACVNIIRIKASDYRGRVVGKIAASAAARNPYGRHRSQCKQNWTPANQSCPPEDFIGTLKLPASRSQGSKRGETQRGPQIPLQNAKEIDSIPARGTSTRIPGCKEWLAENGSSTPLAPVIALLLAGRGVRHNEPPVPSAS